MIAITVPGVFFSLSSAGTSLSSSLKSTAGTGLAPPGFAIDSLIKTLKHNATKQQIL
jgi:hypothetical protein